MELAGDLSIPLDRLTERVAHVLRSLRGPVPSCRFRRSGDASEERSARATMPPTVARALDRERLGREVRHRVDDGPPMIGSHAHDRGPRLRAWPRIQLTGDVRTRCRRRAPPPHGSIPRRPRAVPRRGPGRRDHRRPVAEPRLERRAQEPLGHRRAADVPRANHQDPAHDEGRESSAGSSGRSSAIARVRGRRRAGWTPHHGRGPRTVDPPPPAGRPGRGRRRRPRRTSRGGRRTSAWGMARTVRAGDRQAVPFHARITRASG